MAIEYKSFQTLVNDQVTAIQGASVVPIDFNVGTVELAQVEANASMGIWLEYLANAILATARSSTSVGTYLNTWMAQFQFTRLPATASSGNCTFSRFTTTGQALVPVGSTVKTTDFNVEFTVIPDTTNPNYSPSLMAYVLAPTIGSTLAKVQCNTLGIIGNVGANQITFISSPIPGIDTVDNLLAFTNGKAQESDASFRARFVLYLTYLNKAVLLAYSYVLATIPEITRYNVVENQTFGGGSQPGFVYTVIDDGTGSPSPALIAQAAAAIETVRGLAIQNAVYAPVVTNVTITVDLVINPIVTQTTVTNLVTTALTNYIDKLPFDSTLPYTKLFEIIYEASAYILNVENLVLNGSNVDLPGNVNLIFIVSSISIGYI